MLRMCVSLRNELYSWKSNDGPPSKDISFGVWYVQNQACKDSHITLAFPDDSILPPSQCTSLHTPYNPSHASQKGL